MNLKAIQMQKRDQPFLLGDLEVLAQHSFLGSLHFLVDPVDLAGLVVPELPER